MKNECTPCCLILNLSLVVASVNISITFVIFLCRLSACSLICESSTDDSPLFLLSFAARVHWMDFSPISPGDSTFLRVEHLEMPAVFPRLCKVDKITFIGTRSCQCEGWLIDSVAPYVFWLFFVVNFLTANVESLKFDAYWLIDSPNSRSLLCIVAC